MAPGHIMDTLERGRVYKITGLSAVPPVDLTDAELYYWFVTAYPGPVDPIGSKLAPNGWDVYVPDIPTGIESWYYQGGINYLSVYVNLYVEMTISVPKSPSLAPDGQWEVEWRLYNYFGSNSSSSIGYYFQLGGPESFPPRPPGCGTSVVRIS